MTKLPKLINDYANARIGVAFNHNKTDQHKFEDERKLARARMALEFEINRVTGEEVRLE